MGYYQGLYNAYVHDNKITVNNTNPMSYDLNLQHVYETLAHSKDDLIVK